MSDTRYLSFLDATPPGRITKVTVVRSRTRDIALGEIRWHGAWRQYAFFPEPKTLYNRECMGDICVHIDVLMAERRNG